MSDEFIVWVRADNDSFSRSSGGRISLSEHSVRKLFNENTDLHTRLAAAEARAVAAEARVKRLESSVANFGTLMHSVMDERDTLTARVKELEADLRSWFGCPACGERHDESTMCPPHEVRTRGQAWFHRALAEARSREQALTTQLQQAREALEEAETRTPKSFASFAGAFAGPAWKHVFDALQTDAETPLRAPEGEEAETRTTQEGGEVVV